MLFIIEHLNVAESPVHVASDLHPPSLFVTIALERFPYYSVAEHP